MKSEDYAAVSLIVALDPSDFGSIPERSHQGMAEAIVALELMRGQMVDDENLVFDGQKILEDAPFAYYGNSQGGIMGGALMGLSPVLTRGVLGVGGGPYSLLLPRSHDFDDFFRIFDQKFDDSRDIALIVQGLLQQLWDPTESSGWLHDMDGKSLLLQVGIGDAQVSTLGAQITARGWGAKLVDPPVRDVWGLEAAAAGFTGSALVEWEYSDVPAEPDDQTPPNQGTDVHECVRREPRAKQQLRDFIATGVVNNYCDGPCIGLRAGTCD
jgi:pimeloyl-ACP methyl ester carboxylesterase